MQKESKELSLAGRYLEQGNFVQAKALFAKLMQTECPSAKEGYETASRSLLRRYWRQGKKDIVVEMGSHSPDIALAVARIQGQDALASFSNSSHPDAWLAKLSLNPSIKLALIEMRTAPGFKEIAEGWIALIKGDMVRAKYSFIQAPSQQKMRAELGFAIIDLLEGKLTDGQKRVGTFLNSAVHRFPKFAALFGRRKEQADPIDNADKLLGLLFYKGASEDLEKLLALTPQKEKKGWICLRLGDLEYDKQKNLSRALEYWAKASKHHPQLEIDCLKRQFISSFREGDWEGCKTFFLNYFHALYRKDKKWGCDFIEDLLHHYPEDFYSTLPIPFFADKQAKWVQQTPPEAVHLLAIASEIVHHKLELYLELPPYVPYDHSMPEIFSQNLERLDAVYEDSEFYHLLKARFCTLIHNYKGKRKSLFRLLEMNPLSLQETLPSYVQSVFLTLEDKDKIINEVRQLSLLYPSNYDLARLQMYFDGESHAKQYTQNFPLQLQSVLHLQSSLDKNKPESRQYFEQALSFYGKDEEANWRFWHAVSTSTLPKTCVQKAFDKTLEDEDFCEKVFQKINKYGERRFSHDLLFHWMKKHENAWRPHLYLAFSSIEEKNLDKAMDSLKEACCKKDLPEDVYQRLFSIANFFFTLCGTR